MIDIREVSINSNNKHRILNNINIKVLKGRCVLLCGDSGSGKTTITRLINGLIPHFSENLFLNGEVRINGINTKKTKIYQLSRIVGSVFQNPKSQFFHTDSDSEIVFGLENKGVSPEKIRQRYTDTVKDLDIEKLTNRSIFEMSGGEKQLLAFASVYAMNPQIYVLDEPSSNLDLDAIEKIREILRLLKEQGKTIIIAEHRIYYLMDIADDIFLIKDGRIEKILTNRQFCSLSENERVRYGLRSFIMPKMLDNHKKDKKYDENYGLCVKNLFYKLNESYLLEDISFSISKGEVLGIIGRNGCGKTTLVRILCGLIKESHGIIKLDGLVLNRKARNRLSFCVMQDVNHQLFYESVWKECEKINENYDEEEIERILTKLKLIEYKYKHPMNLSGGQKQRLAIALALLSDKEIVILDEPTSGLDLASMRVVAEIIFELKEKERYIFIVSHDNEFLDMTCDNILTLDKSKYF